MKKVGSYYLNTKLGEGQFGVVYLGQKENTNEYFAVKTVEKKSLNTNPKLKSLFETEMAVMSKIHHPNLLHLYEYLETPNNFYLIMDYCNNGDMEKHVEKNKFLGEQESVYFLMQMMNGFKELHRHKIMHRDIKLANIFLNDDNIIIGDFGFAKSGADMATTKLGSPLTMAPELLNAGPNVIYTNKADLWSIGICFFQMIFGKPPWPNVRSIAELQSKVHNESGLRLPIPTSPPTSNACKDILQRLIESDPNKRIEWDQFFYHPIFSQASPEKKEIVIDVRQSVMFRNNENRVTSMFKANQQTASEIRQVQLIHDPTKIRVDSKPVYNPTTQDREKYINLACKRYIHQKKMIVFMMHCCRRLRNLSKHRNYFQMASDGLMFVSLLLLRKGIILNEEAMSVIEKNSNIFSIERFELFIASEVSNAILRDLKKDSELYHTLMVHLRAKTVEEIGIDNQTCRLIISITDSPNSTIFDIQPELKKHTNFLIDYLRQVGGTLPPALYTELKIVLSHLVLSITNQASFPYLNSGVIFDWLSFERRLAVPGEIDRILASKL